MTHPLAVAIIVSVSAIISPLFAQETSPDVWVYDEVVLVNGNIFTGLIVEENKTGIRFRIVSRQKGRPTVTLTTTFTKEEISGTKKLSEPERTKLKERLAELDPSGRSERARMESLELTTIPWAGKEGAGRRYMSDYFILETGASEDIARRAAVKLEMLSAAFRLFLPPKVPNGKPVMVILTPDKDTPQIATQNPAMKLLNPAIYDPASNRIVCSSELQRLGTELTATRLHHQRQLADIDKYEQDIRRLYKGQRLELDKYLEQSRGQRLKVYAAERTNDEIFEKATSRLFAVLYHEAFHAYAHNFVFLPGKELPRWLNEGMAQLFETASLEAGELRLLDPEPARLKKLIEFTPKVEDTLGAIRSVLTSRPESFLVSHTDQKTNSDKTYLMSWAMAHHLLLRKQKIPGESLNKYLGQLVGNSNSTTAFEEWLGMTAMDYAQDLHLYIRQWERETKRR